MELGERILAVRDFGIGTGLWPEHPWSYFNRGQCSTERMKAEAIDDYTAAWSAPRSFLRPDNGGSPARLAQAVRLTRWPILDGRTGAGKGTA